MRMRKATILVFTLALSSFGLFAQDDVSKFQPLMKTAAGAAGAMRKAVTDGDTAAAAAKGKEMSAAFDQIAAFFKEKGKDDGVKFAMGASAVGKAVAESSDKDAQTAAVGKLGANCGGCHGVYRDGQKFKGL